MSREYTTGARGRRRRASRPRNAGHVASCVRSGPGVESRVRVREWGSPKSSPADRRAFRTEAEKARTQLNQGDGGDGEMSITQVSASQPTVVLVHGAFAESSSWSGVITLLLNDGYPAIAVANPLRGVAFDSDYLRAALADISGDIVLVGHSYGGTVISGGGTGNPNVKALVYIGAFAPEAGETPGDLAGKLPGSTLAETLTSVTLPGGGMEPVHRAGQVPRAVRGGFVRRGRCGRWPSPNVLSRSLLLGRLGRAGLEVDPVMVPLRRARQEHSGRGAPLHGRPRGLEEDDRAQGRIAYRRHPRSRRRCSILRSADAKPQPHSPRKRKQT